MKPTFDGNFRSLLREMEAARKKLKKIPEGTFYKQEDLEFLEDLRHVSIALKMEVEAIIEKFEGSSKKV